MCDTRALADEICDYISAPFGIGLNEHVRKSVALKIAEALKPSHNNARDEISPDTCPDCHGCGNVEISHVNQCYRCNGTGKTSPVA